LTIAVWTKVRFTQTDANLFIKKAMKQIITKDGLSFVKQFHCWLGPKRLPQQKQPSTSMDIISIHRIIKVIHPKPHFTRLIANLAFFPKQKPEMPLSATEKATFFRLRLTQ
jgi:hypothetical protein